MENNKLFRNPDKIWNIKGASPVKSVKRIAVIGVGQGVGVSFVAGALASAFSCRPADEEVSIIELGTSYFYEAYGIEKRFIQREFIRFYDALLCKKNIKGLRNIEDNVNWILHCPLDRTDRELCIADFLRLIHHAEGTLLFFDCSSVCEKFLWDILPEMDAVVAIIDPLPSKLIPGGALIQRLRFVFPKTIFVVNKMNQGVHKGELKRFLKGIDVCSIPLLHAQWLYKAEYNCLLPYAIPNIQTEISQPLKILSRTIIRSID